MARGLNQVTLIGNLTRDPELRYTPSNTAVADFGLAINRTFNNKNDEKEEETTFVDVTVWGRQAENCEQYLAKGAPALVLGRLTFDSWDNNEGQQRSKLKVTARRVDFLSGSERDENEPPATPASTPATDAATPDKPETQDDIPF